MKLSVIITVYNTNIAHFESCLRSLESQTQKDDMEICVLDDGSNIDYSALVSKYNLNYKKTENRGILAARLSGIEMASGDCIAFCDSDDTVSFDYYRPMVECMEQKDADIVINDWAFHTDKSRYFCKQDITIKENFSLSGTAVIEKFFEPCGKQHSLFVLWNKLYRADLLRKAAQALVAGEIAKESCIYSEDAALNFYAFLYAGRLCNVHTGYYFYRIHNSQTVSVISSDRLSLQISQMAKTLNVMQSELEKRQELTHLCKNVQLWRQLMARNHYSHAKSKGYTELYEQIKKSYKVNKLKRSKLSDGYIYTVNVLLPENFEQIDATLRKIYFGNEFVSVFCSKTNNYAMRILLRLADENEKIKLGDKKSDVIVPDAEISPRNRFLHNFFVYTLGTVLFPKGSRLRNFFKAKL